MINVQLKYSFDLVRLIFENRDFSNLKNVFVDVTLIKFEIKFEMKR